jgi:hypothetical protein
MVWAVLGSSMFAYGSRLAVPALSGVRARKCARRSARNPPVVRPILDRTPFSLSFIMLLAIHNGGGGRPVHFTLYSTTGFRMSSPLEDVTKQTRRIYGQQTQNRNL